MHRTWINGFPPNYVSFHRFSFGLWMRMWRRGWGYRIFWLECVWSIYTIYVWRKSIIYLWRRIEGESFGEWCIIYFFDTWLSLYLGLLLQPFYLERCELIKRLPAMKNGWTSNVLREQLFQFSSPSMEKLQPHLLCARIPESIQVSRTRQQLLQIT